jgi:hypothetical protein
LVGPLFDPETDEKGASVGKHSLQQPPRSRRRPRSQALVAAASVAVLALVATVFVMYGGKSASHDVALTAKDVAPQAAVSSPARAYVASADPTPTTPAIRQPVVEAGRPLRRATITASSP